MSEGIEELAYVEDELIDADIAPPFDPVFLYLLKQVILGRMPVFTGIAYASQIMGYDIRHLPYLHPKGEEIVSKILEEWEKGRFGPVWVYPYKTYFVLPRHYLTYHAAWKVHGHIPCFTVGVPILTTTDIRECRGPLDGEVTRRFALWMHDLPWKKAPEHKAYQEKPLGAALPPPAFDQVCEYLRQEALIGRIPVYHVQVPLTLIRPFDFDYHPEDYTEGKQAMQKLLAMWEESGDISPILVYPYIKNLVQSSSYLVMAAAWRAGLTTIPCLSLGIPTLLGIELPEYYGPLELNDVRRLLGTHGSNRV